MLAHKVCDLGRPAPVVIVAWRYLASRFANMSREHREWRVYVMGGNDASAKTSAVVFFLVFS
jgi:hypothetical protein